MSRAALALALVAACSSQGGRAQQAPVAHDAAIARATPDAAVIAAAPADAAPPAVCVPPGDALTLTFDGTTAIVCTEYEPRCVALTDDGHATRVEPPGDALDPAALDVTVAEDGRSVSACAPGGACKKLTPKLRRDGVVSNAEADPSGRYVMLTIASAIEIWDVATAKKRARQELPSNDDDEGETVSGEWAGSLVVVYRQPGAQVPGRGTVYSVGKTKLAKVKDLPGLTAWASLDGQALLVVADGPKILRFDGAGKASSPIDASWLVTEADAMQGVYALAAAGSRIAVVADAAISDPPFARLGFITPATGAHAAVAVPLCTH